MVLTSSSLKIPSEKGFTLVELLVGLAVASIVGALVATTFSSYQAGFTEQNQVATLHEELGGALHLMEREIRMAGYDPDRTAGAGILFGTGLSSTETIVFSADVEGGTTADKPWDGNINATEEISYVLFNYGDPPRSALGRRIRGGNLELVARFVDRLEFQYLDADGNPALLPEEITEINVELEGSTQNEGLNRTLLLSARVPIKNIAITDER